MTTKAEMDTYCFANQKGVVGQIVIDSMRAFRRWRIEFE